MMAVMLLCCQILTEWGAGQGTGWEGEEGGVEVGGGGEGRSLLMGVKEEMRPCIRGVFVVVACLLFCFPHNLF